MYNAAKFDKISAAIAPFNSRDLEVYMNNLNFGTDEVMLDIGCAQGYSTLHVLLPKVKPYLKHLVAADVSTDMLEIAREKHSHPLITYKRVDFSKPITRDVIRELMPEECNGNLFDKVFSTYCVMTIQDQRQVARNFYSLLKPGGEALIITCPKAVDYEINLEVSKLPMWECYMKDVEKRISVYQDSEDPLSEFCNYLEETGFEIIECKSENIVINFNTWAECEAMNAGFNLFLNRIPENDREKYLKDCMAVLKQKRDPNKPTNDWQCDLIHVMKPL